MEWLKALLYLISNFFFPLWLQTGVHLPEKEVEVERKEVYVSFEMFSEEVVDVGVNL